MCPVQAEVCLMLTHMSKAQTQRAHERLCVCKGLGVCPYEIFLWITHVCGIRIELYECVTTVWKIKIPKRKLEGKNFHFNFSSRFSFSPNCIFVLGRPVETQCSFLFSFCIKYFFFKTKQQFKLKPKYICHFKLLFWRKSVSFIFLAKNWHFNLSPNKIFHLLSKYQLQMKIFSLLLLRKSDCFVLPKLQACGLAGFVCA